MNVELVAPSKLKDAEKLIMKVKIVVHKHIYVAVVK